MKKGLLILALSLCGVLVFSACSLFSQEPVVSSIEFSVSSGSPDSELYSESHLVIKPDNELRTLAISYARDFSNDIYEDIKSDGVIGGNFFDRFEEILLEFDGYQESQTELALGQGEFYFSITQNENETKNYLFEVEDSSTEYVLVKSFYSDVIELFSEDVY